MPDVNALMRQVNADIRASASREIMSLGQFIAALETVDRKDAGVRMDFSYSGPGKLDSYRGYYDHLALMGLATESEKVTVQEVLDDAKAAIGKEFYGYKGGEYVMDNDTPLWWANARNECHDTGVVGVTDRGYQMIINTAFVEL